MADIGRSLVTAFDYVWERFTDRLVGLNDPEYFWEPAPGSWTLRKGATGSWDLDGREGGGPAPDPAPVTTIAWRVGHVGALTLGGFAARRFPGSGATPPHEIVLPSTGAEAVGFLDARYSSWRDPLSSLTDDEWRRALGPTWGPYAKDSTVDLAIHVFDEVVHHAAEIALLRDLYPVRNALGR